MPNFMFTIGQRLFEGKRIGFVSGIVQNIVTRILREWIVRPREIKLGIEFALAMYLFN